jgi:ribonuclease T2
VGVPGSHKSKVILAVLVLGALLAWFSARRAEPPAPVPKPAASKDRDAGKPVPAHAAGRPASFDFYLLALTLHPAFCAEHQGKGECRTGGHRPLVIHGLWPERLEPRTYPHDCPAPPLDLDHGLEQQLAALMPGVQDGLHVHEWREHGGCSGLDDDLYYRRTLELARALDGALGARLTTLEGGETTAAELREIAGQFQPGIGATFTLHCRTLRGSGNRPVLFEVRQCVDDDGPGGAPATLLDCSTLRRQDQGCGKSFLIAGGRG